MRTSLLGLALVLIVSTLGIFVFGGSSPQVDTLSTSEIQAESTNEPNLSSEAIPKQIVVERTPRRSAEQTSVNVEISIDQAIEFADNGDPERAARILAELYGGIDTYSTAYRKLLLHHYSELLAELGYHAEAIQILEQLLKLPDLEPSIELSALKLLGESQMSQENWQEAEARFKSWLEISESQDPDVLLNLSYAYYQQELWGDAIEPAIDHINLLIDKEQEITRERLMYINSLAFTTEDWDNATWVTQVMINEFNNVLDWRNLIVIYRNTGNEAAVEQAFRDAEEAGVLNELETALGLR